MNIDEAIAHCNEVAETQEWMSGTYDDGSMGKKLCKECASEHRQLAEWLRELKAYKEQLPHEIAEYKKLQAERLEKEVNRTDCNYYLVEFFKGYISGFSFVEGIIAMINEEENADDDIHS